MKDRKILWIDDEVDLLRPHILLLAERGYSVTPISSGEDALVLLKKSRYDLVLLDEVMPGKDGLATLSGIKEIDPHVPVVMVTKIDEDRFMREAFGSRVEDYLIKPFNPNQLISTCTRILDRKNIVEERLARDYVKELSSLKEILNGPIDWRRWIEIYLKLTEWELLLEVHRDVGLMTIHRDEKDGFNSVYGKYIEANYGRWLKGEDSPTLSVDLVEKHVLPPLRRGKVLFLLLDCMRLDQWMVMESLLTEYYEIKRDYCYSVLPTATAYARNAIFSGLYPSEIQRYYPHLWDANEGSLNKYEPELLVHNLRDLGLRLDQPPKYVKILNAKKAESTKAKLDSLLDSPLTAIVVNFMDILTHSRSESSVLQEIAPDEGAFRSLTQSWFSHSAVYEILKAATQYVDTVVLTSDHGFILGRRGTPVYGGRNISPNLRFKFGHNLKCDPRAAVVITEPSIFKLPALPGKRYVIAKEDYYFLYPPRFSEYDKRYKFMFHHGGISLEEMILPVVTMSTRR